LLYDLGGRLTGEQYVGCGEAQPHEQEEPSTDNDLGGLVSQVLEGTVTLDVVYHYDEYPGWTARLPAGRDSVPAAASGVLCRATGVTDRGQRSAIAYDDRGNVIWAGRQLAVIPDALGLGTLSIVEGRPAQGETPRARTKSHPLYLHRASGSRHGGTLAPSRCRVWRHDPVAPRT